MPLAIAILFTGFGLIAMVAWRLRGTPAARSFFSRSAFEAVPREVAAGAAGPVDAIGVAESEQ